MTARVEVNSQLQKLVNGQITVLCNISCLTSLQDITVTIVYTCMIIFDCHKL